MKLQQHKIKGYLLISAVILIVIVGFLAASVAMVSTTTSREASQQLGSLQALYLAESGLERGLLDYKNNFSLQNPTTFCDGAWKSTNSLGTGQYRYKCTHYPLVSTTLSAGITDAIHIIPLTSLTSFAPMGQVKIDSEFVNYAGTASGTAICGAGNSQCLIANVRGANNSTAATHSASATVTQTALSLIDSEGAMPSLSAATSEKRMLQKAILLQAPLGNAWAVGKNGTILRWSGATNWERWVNPSGYINPPTNNRINDVDCAPEKGVCYACGVSGTVLFWDGTGWTKLADSGSGDLNEVDAYDKNSGLFLMVSSDKSVYNCVTNGTPGNYTGNCSQLPFTFSKAPNSITCGDATHCMVAEDSSKVAGGVLSAGNWGWTEKTLNPSNRNLLGISCADATHCWAVGTAGTIQRYNGTEDYPNDLANWTYNNVSNKALNAVSCVVKDISGAVICWAVGADKNKFFKYENNNWVGQPFGSIAVAEYYDVSCSSLNLCFAVGQQFAANKSTTAQWEGITWIWPSVVNDPKKDLHGVTVDAAGLEQLMPLGWRETFV